MPHASLDGHQRRAQLQAARLMLIFTPDVCGDDDRARAQLCALLPHIDVLQVRVKPVADKALVPGAPSLQAPARATYDWTLFALEQAAQLERPPLVLVNDRVDVAMSLRERGVDGVHVGRSDLPPAAARELLGPEMLIGLSTHDVRQVVMAAEESVDYVGFGPIFPTTTKGYTKAIGPEAAWVASVGSSLPLFPIGGIDATNVQSLAEIGRAAISGALLKASDPEQAARDMTAAIDGRRAS